MTLEIVRFKVNGFGYSSQPGTKGTLRLTYDYMAANGISKGAKPLDIVVEDDDKQFLEDFIDKIEEVVTNYEETDEIEIKDSVTNKLVVMPKPDWFKQMLINKGKPFVDAVKNKLGIKIYD